MWLVVGVIEGSRKEEDELLEDAVVHGLVVLAVVVVMLLVNRFL